MKRQKKCPYCEFNTEILDNPIYSGLNNAYFCNMECYTFYKKTKEEEEKLEKN